MIAAQARKHSPACAKPRAWVPPASFSRAASTWETPSTPSAKTTTTPTVTAMLTAVTSPSAVQSTCIVRLPLGSGDGADGRRRIGTDGDLVGVVHIVGAHRV